MMCVRSCSFAKSEPIGAYRTDRPQLETSHYGLRAEAPNAPLRVSSAKTLLNVIKKNFGTLPFCRRYLDRLGQDKYLLGVCSSRF